MLTSPHSRGVYRIKTFVFIPALLLGLVQPLFTTICQAAGAFEAHVTDNAGRPAADVVVSLRPRDFVPPGVAVGAPHAAMDQRSRRFVPHVLSVQVGTAVDFPNSDDIRHQVYSFSKPKRFELPLYAGVPAEPVVFDQPGVVVLGCNIHDWMLGYIYVADTPYFGQTDEQGDIRIGALPAGRYEVRLWHPQATPNEPRVMETVRIARSAELKRGYTLDLREEPAGDAPVSAGDSLEDKFNRWRN